MTPGRGESHASASQFFKRTEERQKYGIVFSLNVITRVPKKYF
jgi:hypothetical protein